MEKKNILLVTGFLGAGKSTLVNRILSDDRLKKIGVLINDYGKVPVDGKLLRQKSSSDFTLYEVAGGSIFCSCKTATFAEGLRAFVDTPVETLVIEASGMSDPSGLDKILQENRLSQYFLVSQTVCVIDPVKTPKLWNTLPAIKRQISIADLLLINKADLLDEEARAQIDSALKEINPEAPRHYIEYGKHHPSWITNPRTHRTGDGLESCNRPANRPGSAFLSVTEENIDRITPFLEERSELFWRAKGWISGEGGSWYLSDNRGQIEKEAAAMPKDTSSGIMLIGSNKKISQLQQEWSRMDG